MKKILFFISVLVLLVVYGCSTPVDITPVAPSADKVDSTGSTVPISDTEVIADSVQEVDTVDSELGDEEVNTALDDVDGVLADW